MRAYTLAKARCMIDGVRGIQMCPGAARASTPEEAKNHKIEAAPRSLKRRVEWDEALPEVEVKKAKNDMIGEVVEFVLRDLKSELVVEILEILSDT